MKFQDAFRFRCALSYQGRTTGITTGISVKPIENLASLYRIQLHSSLAIWMSLQQVLAKGAIYIQNVSRLG